MRPRARTCSRSARSRSRARAPPSGVTKRCAGRTSGTDVLLAFDWTQLAQQIVIGLASGGVWATLAVALVLIYRSTGVVNFAQGEMAMFSTFIAWTLVHHGFSYWAAFFVTVALSFAGGVAVERAVIRPVERAPVLTVVIVTLGLFFLVNGAARWIWSPEVRSLPNAFSTRPITVAGVAFSISDLGTIAVSLAAVALLWAFFRFTKLGLASRAAAVNPDASRLVGVRVTWMPALGWGLAAAMGAVSGMLTAPRSEERRVGKGGRGAGWAGAGE